MKESYRESLASCSGLDPYAGDGDIAGVASVRGNAGQPSNSEIRTSACRSCPVKEKATSRVPLVARCERTRRSHRPCACADTLLRHSHLATSVSLEHFPRPHHLSPQVRNTARSYSKPRRRSVGGFTGGQKLGNLRKTTDFADRPQTY